MLNTWLYAFTIGLGSDTPSINEPVNDMIRFCNAGRHKIIGLSSDEGNVGDNASTMYNGLERAIQACQDNLADCIVIPRCALLHRNSLIRRQLYPFFWNTKLQRPRIVSIDGCDLAHFIQAQLRLDAKEYAHEIGHKQNEREKWLWSQTMWHQNKYP